NVPRPTSHAGEPCRPAAVIPAARVARAASAPTLRLPFRPRPRGLPYPPIDTHVKPANNERRRRPAPDAGRRRPRRDGPSPGPDRPARRPRRHRPVRRPPRPALSPPLPPLRGRRGPADRIRPRPDRPARPRPGRPPRPPRLQGHGLPARARRLLRRRAVAVF